MAIVPQKKPGSGFTNIQRVLEANKANKLGSAVGSGVTGFVGQGRQQLGSASSKFQEQMGKGALGTQAQQQERQDIIGKATGEQAEQVGQAEQQKFSRFLSGQYTGPQQMQDLSGVSSQAKEIQRGLGTQEGRQSLLGRFIGKGQPYTTGQRRTDTLLLGQSGQQLNRAQQNLAQLNQDIRRQEQSAQQQAQAETGKAQTFAQETQKQLASKQGEIDAALQAQLDVNTPGTVAYQEAQRRKQMDQFRESLLKEPSGGPAQTMAYDPYRSYQDIGTEGSEQDRVIRSLAHLEAAYQGKLDPKTIGEIMARRAAEQGTVIPKMVTGEVKSNLDRTLSALGKGVSQGFLNPEQAEQIKRMALESANMGSTRTVEELFQGLSTQEAKNLTKEGIMSEQQAASLNALARLGGTQFDPRTQNRQKYEQSRLEVAKPEDIFTRDFTRAQDLVGQTPAEHLISNPLDPSEQYYMTGMLGGGIPVYQWDRNKLSNVLKRYYEKNPSKQNIKLD